MISQQKLPTLERGAQTPAPHPLPTSGSADLVNNRPHPAHAVSGRLALFDKVRNYTSAAQVRATGLYPYFRTISSAQDTEVIIDGKKVLMLGSNSYLGLTNHPKIKAAAKTKIETGLEALFEEIKGNAKAEGLFKLLQQEVAKA